MGDFKPIKYPFIIIAKGQGKTDEVILFQNELTLISVENLFNKGFQHLEFKTFDTEDGAEKWFIAYHDSITANRYLLPNDFLTKHERKTAKGRIFWLAKDKKMFCKLYLDADYKSFDKHELHFFMYANRGGIKFNNSGLPEWQYTNEPVKLKWQNGL